MEFEFKDMIKMEINTCKKITVEGMGEVTVLKVPRGWVYFYANTSTFVPERDKRRSFGGPGQGQGFRGGFNRDSARPLNES